VSTSPGHRSKPAPIAPAGFPAGATVCTACALLCDDCVVRPAEGRFERLCERGAESFRRHHAAGATRVAATIDGRPADVAAAIAAAATRLSAARRVLVTGLNDLTIEGVTKACDVAEALGAAIAPAVDDERHPGGSMIARCGEITAAWEELRDRADLVIFWGHDPADSHPRFVERFVAPPLPFPRRTIAVGRVPLRLPPSADHVHLSLDADDDDVDLARLLLASVLERPLGAAPERLRDAALALRSAIDAARCVGIVTGRPDPLGLSAWGVIGVVRALSRRLPAFEVPLDSGAHAPNAAGAKAVLTWRYGANASTARAGDAGGSPAEAIDLVATGAVDAILALGRLPPHVDEAISTGINPRAVIRIAPDAPAGAHDGVWVPCRELFDEAGTLLRGDGRTVELASGPDDSLPSAVVLLAALRERLVAPQTTETEGGKA
jgi:formylmethanofuran dehydrogenase subunit B